MDKEISKERITHLWFGIAFAAVIAVIVAYYVKEQRQFHKLELTKKAAQERLRYPNPATLDEFCAGAETNITPEGLFNKPLGYLKQRVCFMGSIQMAFTDRLRDTSYHHIQVGVRRFVLTITWPPENKEETYFGNRISCGGTVEPPLREEQFDYLAHINCQFMELDGVNKERIYPQITDPFKENGWRRAILDKVGEDQREIWMDPKNEFGLVVTGAPQGFKKAALIFIYPREPENEETIPTTPNENCRLLFSAITPISQLDQVNTWFVGAMFTLEGLKEGTQSFDLSDKKISLIRYRSYNLWHLIVEPK